MNNTKNTETQSFMIEYQCFTCKHQWVYTSNNIEPLVNCVSCGEFARAKDVVSWFF